jgi:hypothetical protein
MFLNNSVAVCFVANWVFFFVDAPLIFKKPTIYFGQSETSGPISGQFLTELPVCGELFHSGILR